MTCRARPALLAVKYLDLDEADHVLAEHGGQAGSVHPGCRSSTDKMVLADALMPGTAPA
jgi:hypothetical protein